MSWFTATSGRVSGVVGLAAGALVVVLAVVEGPAPVGVVLGLLLALLSWLVLLRPRVGTRGSELLLRGMVSTVVVPLARVESVTARQVLAVWAGGRRYVSAAVGHPFREINRQRRIGGQLEEINPGKHAYADQVCELVVERAKQARREGAPEGDSRREWAWPEITALAALGVALLVVLLV